MHIDDFITLTAPLRITGGGRVWSLMISLFGDLAQQEGTTIPGPLLSEMMTLLMIKPEAARVALHRLRNDGWIASQKSGRISQHRLTPKGLRESAAASPRIYAAPDDGPQDWQLVLLESTETAPSDDMTVRGFVAVMPRVFIGPGHADAPPQALSLPGNSAPDWLRRQAQPEALTIPYTMLHRSLSELNDALTSPVMLTPLQTAVLRGLVVHNWRRLILKHPTLPGPLIDPDSPGHLCHVLVSDMLNRFPRPPLDGISAQDRT